MLNVVMLHVIMMNVVAPLKQLHPIQYLHFKYILQKSYRKKFFQRKKSLADVNDKKPSSDALEK
jgi:hypothetical protein